MLFIVNEPSASSILYVTVPNPVTSLSISVAVTVTSGCVGTVFSSILVATYVEVKNIHNIMLYVRDHKYRNTDCRLNSLYSAGLNIGLLSLTSVTLITT